VCVYGGDVDICWCEAVFPPRESDFFSRLTSNNVTLSHYAYAIQINVGLLILFELAPGYSVFLLILLISSVTRIHPQPPHFTTYSDP
jgi:hypothetical protein